jgi:hypothetical protein
MYTNGQDEGRRMLTEERLDDKVGIHIEVPRSVRRRLKLRAAEEDTTIREVCMKALDEYLSSEPEELAS